jgi:hypothetical protein
LAKAGWKWPFGYTLLWGSVALWKAWRELSPKQMQLIKPEYNKRKLLHNRLLQQALGDRRSVDVGLYQRECLQLIASYVRGHRLDLKATEIFVNLLCLDGEDMVVVARDHGHRQDGARYKKKHLLAYKVQVTAEPAVTGDVCAEYPETPPKPYMSILAVPVFQGSDVVGVVSIDSVRRYHFDRDIKNLLIGIEPYVSLLSWTLGSPPAKNSAGKRRRRKKGGR